MRNRIQCLGLPCIIAIAVMGLPAHAQVQRSFINLGFEQPELVPKTGQTGCYVQIPDTSVPGWTTNHTSMDGLAESSMNGCSNLYGLHGRLIEIWRTGFNGVASAEGTQFAELNAQENSRIYQSVCMSSGEQVTWSFLHRGRNSSSTLDVAEFNVDSSANTVVTARTSNNGSNTWTPATDCAASEGSIIGNSCNTPALVGTWRRYSGTFTWNGTSGTHNIGFEALSSAGNISTGNFIDDIRFTLRPYVEFTAASYSIPEQGAATVLPQVRVIGVVPAGGMTILVNATGGTATSGSDYTIGNIVVPANDYGEGQLFDVPLTIINDTIIEDNETILLSLGASPGNYTIASTSSCGGVAITSTVATIIDNDIDLRTSKTVDTETPTAGMPFTYTVVFENHTARPTIAPTASRDVTAAIVDNAPAGITFQSWTCAATGGAVCPEASGTGTIIANALLPAGNGAAGGRLTYTIMAVANGAPDCGNIANISTIASPTGFEEGTSVQPNFTSPAPGGPENNTASAIIDPLCRPTLTLNKITANSTGGPFGFTLTNTLQTTGSVTTTIANTPAQVDGDNSTSGLQPFTVAALDTPITISESIVPDGWTLDDALCTASGNPVGSLSGDSYAIPATSVVEGASISCAFTNRGFLADLSISKTNNSIGGPDGSVWSGSETTYTLVIRNDGPDAANNAIVTEQPDSGLSGCAATCPPAELTGGATCPASLSDLLAPGGTTIPLFPAHSSVTVLVTCTVD